VIYQFRIKKKELRKMGRLENKVALVTGASSGMGYEIAKLFAKEGASVVVIARRKEKLAALIAQIEADGGKGIAVAGDVTTEDDVQHAVKTAVQQFGKLDIVVNNAGILDKMRPVTELDDDLWNAVINVNLTGPMRVFRAAIPEMEKIGGGAFVTVASLGGLKAGIAGSAYIASKHGFWAWRKMSHTCMQKRISDPTSLLQAALTPKWVLTLKEIVRWEWSDVRWVWARCREWANLKRLPSWLCSSRQTMRA
jgi:NADP-dependent 3-hydroxy acid dehydrogenase YdfG